MEKEEQIGLALKCYNDFCDELITGLKNISEMALALSFDAALNNDIKGSAFQYDRSNIFKEIAGRIIKERELHYPVIELMDWCSLNTRVRLEVDKKLDELIPRDRLKGNPRKYHEVEMLKQKISIFLAEMCKRYFEYGMIYASMVRKKDE